MASTDELEGAVESDRPGAVSFPRETPVLSRDGGLHDTLRTRLR